jgi:phenylacetate-coenzyme A ligase PaaK-like adenylate-forming protein
MLSLPERLRLLEFVTERKHSIYRKHYRMNDSEQKLTLSREEEWRALPPITKDDLLGFPLAERSFLPLGKLDHLRVSSGTSGKPPLFSPRTHVRNMSYRLAFHDFKGAFMCYTVPMMPHWHERFLVENGIPATIVSYDPSAPEISARIAKLAGVTGVSLFVYHVPRAAVALKNEGVAQNVRLLEITGEICTNALYEYIRETFPHATILQSYNSSEVEDAHIGMPCKPMDGTEPLAVYHAKDTHYLELVDTRTGEYVEPSAGAEGDLLVTAYPGEPASMPLVRYKIGDTVRVVEASCPHGGFSFTVLGRTDLDFLKVAGGVLRADEIARVLRLFPSSVTDRFCMRCEEIQTDGGPKLSPVLEVETRHRDVDMEVLGRDIAAHLRINPGLTWERGVAEGRFLPLRLAPLSVSSGSKHRRIIM